MNRLAVAMNRPFAQLLPGLFRDGASGDGRSVTCIWIALRTVRNRDKKNSFLLSETLKSYAGDWPTVTGCPVSNPGYNCANGLFVSVSGCFFLFLPFGASAVAFESFGLYVSPLVWQYTHSLFLQKNIIGSTEALPILCVRYNRWERERERRK